MNKALIVIDAQKYFLNKWTEPKVKPILNNIKNNVVYKNVLSDAKKPQIIEALKENKVQEVHLCGFDTDCCVLATAYDLFDLGLKPVILENLTWSTSKDKLHNAAIKMVN